MKKIILLMFVTIFPLMAFKLDVKDKINPKCLTNIIKNGWNDKNKTLNNLIVKNAEKNLDIFNAKIKHPLIGQKGRDKYGMPKLPKMNITRDELVLMLAYAKYLEKNGRREEAKNLYLSVLNGLKNNKEIPSILITLIYDTVLQSFIEDALNQAIKEKTFSTEDKKELCELAKKALILNKNEFIEAMKLESETVDKVWEKTSFDDAKKYFKIGVNYSNSVQGAFMKDIGNKIKKYNKIYYKKLFAAIDSEDTKDFNKLEEYIKKEKESISSIRNKIKLFLSLVVINIKASMGVTIKDFGDVSTLLAKKLVFIAIPKIKATFFDYKKQLEANKRLLKELGCE